MDNDQSITKTKGCNMTYNQQKCNYIKENHLVYKYICNLFFYGFKLFLMLINVYKS